MSKNTSPSALYDSLVEDLYPRFLEENPDADILCLDWMEKGTPAEADIRAVPLRYRIIALGFLQKLTPEEVNRKLTENGCSALYPRSFWEATLIFAFQNGMTYPAWKKLCAECRDLYDSLETDAWFRDKKITYEELERYVLENSGAEGDILTTRKQTRLMQDSLRGLDGSVLSLRTFLAANAAAFSEAREKTRYYFCKYLYYYLNRRVENYLEACERGSGLEEALSGLTALKTVTVLRRRKTMPVAEKKQLIRSSALSCGEMFDSFNYFFFGYVNTDWAEILTECYDAPEDIPPKQRKALAAFYRRRDRSFNRLSDEDVIRASRQAEEEEQDADYAQDGTRGYGKNRAGENTLYKFIKGTLDIDRTTLLCFLLFFSDSGLVPKEHRLTRERMDDILLGCGYAPLDMENDIDWVFLEFTESDRPLDLLDEIIVSYAQKQENSFLYRIYNRAVSNAEELRDSMGIDR